MFFNQESRGKGAAAFFMAAALAIFFLGAACGPKKFTMAEFEEEFKAGQAVPPQIVKSRVSQGVQPVSSARPALKALVKADNRRGRIFRRLYKAYGYSVTLLEKAKFSKYVELETRRVNKTGIEERQVRIVISSKMLRKLEAEMNNPASDADLQAVLERFCVKQAEQFRRSLLFPAEPLQPVDLLPPPQPCNGCVGARRDNPEFLGVAFDFLNIWDWSQVESATEAGHNDRQWVNAAAYHRGKVRKPGKAAYVPGAKPVVAYANFFGGLRWENLPPAYQQLVYEHARLIERTGDQIFTRQEIRDKRIPKCMILEISWDPATGWDHRFRAMKGVPSPRL